MGFEGYPIFRQTHFVKAWTQQFRNYPAVSLLVRSASYCFSLPCCWMSHFLLINIPTSSRRAAQVSTVAPTNLAGAIISILLVGPFAWWMKSAFQWNPLFVGESPLFCCFKLQIPLEPLGCSGWYQIHSSFSSITLLSTSCRAKTLTSATPPKRVATGWGLSSFMLVAWLYCGYSATVYITSESPAVSMNILS